MNNLVNLIPLIGAEKTVLITGTEFDLDDSLDFNDQIFVHYAKESRLQRYDLQQQEILQYYIESKECSQVIFVGSIDHTLINSILSDHSANSPSSALKFNLNALLKNNQASIVKPTIRTQLFIELNVINQCKLLMDYYFVKPRVDKKLLNIKGVVTDMLGDKLKPIFHNGIFYNDIISLN